MRYEYTVSLYTDTGEVEADDEDDAKIKAAEYVRQQFSDALSQADWSFFELDGDDGA